MRTLFKFILTSKNKVLINLDNWRKVIYEQFKLGSTKGLIFNENYTI